MQTMQNEVSALLLQFGGMLTPVRGSCKTSPGLWCAGLLKIHRDEVAGLDQIKGMIEIQGEKSYDQRRCCLELVGLGRREQ